MWNNQKIPEGWSVKKLKECLEIKHGKPQHDVEDKNGIYPILASGGEIGRTNSFLCNKPSVLIGRKGTIDKPQYMDTPFWTVDTLFYSLIKSEYLAKYIFYKFETINWNKYNEGSTIPSLSSSTIHSIKVLLPPLAEQEKIAEILGTWDEAIEKLSSLIEQKKLLKKSLMQKLIYTRTNATKYKVADLFELGRGRVISKNEIDTHQGVFPVYSSQTSDNGILGYINTYDFQGEYITWTTDGANAGEVFYRNGKFNCTNVCGTAKAKEKNVNLYYAMSFLNHVSKKYVSYVGNPKLMNGVFAIIPLILPNIEIQNKVAEVLSTADDEIDLLNKKLTLFKEQKKGLMQQLLTGNIRVKVN